jgi:tripartite-type tricarboxylate transporter receptor subunit TctC
MTETDLWPGGRVAAAAALLLAATSLPATAQVIDLEGKTVTIVHNASPGGATGLGSQLAADAWTKTMAGNPTMVVQSVQGGALTKGINQVLNARPDGLTIGWLAWQGSTRILDPEPLQIPFEDFGLIAGVGAGNFFLHVRTDVGDGIETREEVAELDSLSFGGFSPKSAASMQTAGALDMLGVDWNFVSGFGGDGPLRAAQARGEIEAYPATAVIYKRDLRDGPIAEGETLGAWHYSWPTEDNSAMTPDPSYDGEVPTFAEYYEQVRGEAPSGPIWEMIQFHGNVSNKVNWIIVAPPGTPEEHVEMLRESFREATSTPEYLEAATQLYGAEPNIEYAEEIIQIVDDVQNTSEELKDIMREYISRMEG